MVCKKLILIIWIKKWFWAAWEGFFWPRLLVHVEEREGRNKQLPLFRAQLVPVHTNHFHTVTITVSHKAGIRHLLPLGKLPLEELGNLPRDAWLRSGAPGLGVSMSNAKDHLPTSLPWFPAHSSSILVTITRALRKFMVLVLANNKPRMA